MDFSLNEIQEMLADSIEKFIANDYDFESRQQYSASAAGYNPAVWQTFAELGWTSVPFSEADGGIDGGAVEMMVVMERFGRGLVVEPYLANVVLAGGVLRRMANAMQKQQLLTPLIAGEIQATLAGLEPQSRYDVADIATSAVADDDGWTITGRKAYVLNGATADWLIVAARTSGKQRDSAGISLFAVDARAKGISVRDYATVDGGRAAEIEFRNVRVGADALLGDANKGFAALQDTILDATLAVCAEAIGIMSALTEKTIAFAKDRVQFGVPIGSFQALQHRMVEMYMAAEQSKSLLMWAAMNTDSAPDDRAIAVHSIKYQVGTAGRRIAEEAVQIHGGMGVTWELDVAHYFKRLIAIDLMFGNADWHLDRMSPTSAE